MGLKNTLLNVVTLGGHARIQQAINSYEQNYNEYHQLYAQARQHEQQINHKIQQIGETTISAFRTIESPLRLLRLEAPTAAPAVDPSPYKVQSGIYHVQRLYIEYSGTQTTAMATGLGTATAVGSWTVVSFVGTASTGTAIASLSGAAATNATLAWFGGGAIAAGGGGMAAGMMTLGGLVAVPLIAFSAWKTHSKAEEILKASEEVLQASQLVSLKLPELQAYHDVVHAQLGRISGEERHLFAVYNRVKRLLLPWGFLSHMYRLLRSLFGYGYFKVAEQPLIDSLQQQLVTFSVLFGREHQPELQDQSRQATGTAYSVKELPAPGPSHMP